MAKVVIIGAGSLGFSSKLTSDILTYEPTCDAHFALVDTDEGRLPYAKQIAERIFTEGNYPKATASATADRREALEDADYVIISILVGGYEAIKTEIDIPLKYGISQCIGDTLTPGGIMRCLRTLPVMIDIGRDIMELCPNAVVLNYTNPMSMLSWGMLDACPELKYVGLCHSVQGTTGEWAHRCEVDLKDVNFQCAGINHQAWITRFERDGVDLLPQIRELACRPDIWTGDTTRMEYVKHFGFPVTESSGHVSEYNWWFRKNDTELERYCDPRGGRWNGETGFIKELYDRPDWEGRMKSMANWETPVNLNRSMEYGSRIVNACAGGLAAVIHGNVKNDGLIDNLPDEAIVEVPILVDKNGLQPIRVGALPPHLAAINRAQISVQELAVKAVFERDPERVFQAMMMDPLTAMSCTLDQIRAMTVELLEAHREFTPILEGKSLASKPVMYDKKTTDAEKHIDPAEAGI
ncbi:MAG: alpha-galactosidase [Lentisphaerae bacterium]|nr:alpha-galactosidase [Lentisphaerota bacterium]MBT4821477.1 alpha-galactosidase [Lentisphaerota bacterium]MBT5608900.1 alpha-galactosidase [Lentisphaerota bacterium]MBT7057388.1 alpha-galactosidase [Lentisphaerota bacterium]MBT7842766.1 alpha-galactosidase [Lentisphaerota bacterium]